VADPPASSGSTTWPGTSSSAATVTIFIPLGSMLLLSLLGSLLVYLLRRL
jgi:hypothetical protein